MFVRSFAASRATQHEYYLRTVGGLCLGTYTLLSELVLQFQIDVCWTVLSVDFHHHSFRFVVLDHRFGFFVERLESFLDSLNVVVGSCISNSVPATRLSPLQKALLHNCVRTLHVDNAFHVHILHVSFPSLDVLLVSRQPVDKIFAFEVVLLHLRSDELNNEVTRHQFSFLNTRLDHCSFLRALLLGLSQKITSG